MKVYVVIKDDILAYSYFAVRSVRMYLYNLVSRLECTCALVAYKIRFVRTWETDFSFSIF